MDNQRDTLCVGYDMSFAARLGSICGVRTRVGPPKTARTEALSTTARDQSIPPSRPSELRSLRCNSDHTPAFVQSRRRRQQVTPSPQPNSGGSKFHAMPLRNTKTMPAKHARSGTRGRPPFGLAAGGPNSGATSAQSSSLTNEENAISSPLFTGSSSADSSSYFKVLKQLLRACPRRQACSRRAEKRAAQGARRRPTQNGLPTTKRRRDAKLIGPWGVGS